MINNPIIYTFSKEFTNHRKETNRVAVFSSRPFPTFLNTGTIQQSGKQDSFRHILKSSGSMYENSGSKFFRTTTGTQSGPHAFDDSRLVMTFLTILGVTEILCSFRLVLEGKTNKEIPKSSRLEFFEKFLTNNFPLIDAEEKSQEPSFWKVDSFVLVAYASLTASRALLQ